MLTNYREDMQQSMLRFGNLLASNEIENKKFQIHEIFPKPLFIKFFSIKKIRKWAGYLDKYLLFPKKMNRYFKSLSKPIDLVHIIDHSNAPYFSVIKKLSPAKRIITCHDLIAVQTSLGEFPLAPKTSRSGQQLQKWILNSLKNAHHFACDSNQTRKTLNRIHHGSEPNSSVVHLGTDSILDSVKGETLALPFDPPRGNYILHVGSGAWYKNRGAIFKSFKHVCEKLSRKDMKLLLVGPKPQEEELDASNRNWTRANKDNIYNINNISENSLQVLYKYSNALIFPSHVEGFGWPPMEAAYHGCPVVTSKTGAIFDILGDYCQYIDPNDQDSINQALVNVLCSKPRKKHCVSLPNYNHCRQEYLNIYSKLLEE